ncbi:Ig-like domain-containing protein, partial [Mycolicibacterium hassiacum]|uniref:Ig-like domain-containing protein n=1 Tax=Mycolicibacterium hassiacum TaxID=46351 RepID=UPI0022EC1DBA
DDLAEVGEDGSVAIDVLGNDTDPDAADTLTVQSFTQPTNGGSVTLNPDGTFTYTPGANAGPLGVGESLTDTFTYTVTDSHGAAATGTVAVTVTGINDAPTAN